MSSFGKKPFNERLKEEAIFIFSAVAIYSAFILTMFYFVGETIEWRNYFESLPVVILVAYIFKTIFTIMRNLK
jgi:hypothetical protein